MFENIQKKILLKYPLLWNTKFVPMMIIGIIFNLIYFFIGYYDGTIDFTGEYIYGENDDELLGFGTFFSLLIFLIWFWYYSKNNSFKSFYKKPKNSLFLEFIYVFTFLFIISNFFLSYNLGKQLHQRSYFSYEEAKERCKIISLADIFIDGSFNQTPLDSVKMGMIYKDSLINDSIFHECLRNDKVIHTGKIFFKNRYYNEYSLINRNSTKFSINSFKENFINELELKNRLVNNDKVYVRKLLHSYLDIIKSHGLHTNLNVDTWLNNVYYYPDFKKFNYIFPYTYNVENQKNKGFYIQYDYYDEVIENQKVEYIFDKKYRNDIGINYSKYFIEHYLLKNRYQIISTAYTSRFFRLSELLFIYCFVFGISLFVFSLRISKLKNWFISIVSIILLGILFGILSNLWNYESIAFSIMVIISFLIFWIYFMKICKNKKEKKLSIYIVNFCIWSIPMLIPFVYFLIYELIRKQYIYYNHNEEVNLRTIFRDNFETMFAINLVFSILILFFFSRLLRTWKGLAEE